jgi:hypothetical protein
MTDTGLCRATWRREAGCAARNNKSGAEFAAAPRTIADDTKPAIAIPPRTTARLARRACQQQRPRLLTDSNLLLAQQRKDSLQPAQNT